MHTTSLPRLSSFSSWLRAPHRGNWLRLVLYGALLGLVLWFVWEARDETRQVGTTLRRANPLVVLFGAMLTLGYVLQQAFMYQASFRAAGLRVGLGATARLFLRRNLLSVVLPAGGVSSLAFFSEGLAADPADQPRVHVGSTVYAVTGIFSVLVVALPALLLVLRPGGGQLTGQEWAGLLVFGGLNGLLLALGVSLLRRGLAFRLAQRWAPAVAETVAGLAASGGLNRRAFAGALGVSVLIELTGIAHLLLAMLALGQPLNWAAATVGYVVATVLLIVSPVLRGAGLIELSLAYLLTRYDYSLSAAISITLLYRFFEFWLPLVLGAATFVVKRQNLLLRLGPALAVGLLGLINLVSCLTPAVPARLAWLLRTTPGGAVHVSQWLTFGAGMGLLFLAYWLLKGYRFAYRVALGLALLSVATHLGKAIDYEEATVAALVGGSLLITRQQYGRTGNRRAHRQAVGAGLALAFGALVFGVVVFWLIEEQHFGARFSLNEAVRETLLNFLLLGTRSTLPLTPLAQAFTTSLHGLGLLALGLLLYGFSRRRPLEPLATAARQEQARQLAEQYGTSSNDYFKTYYDKEIFLNAAENGFLAFRTARGYAMVLETPVAADLAAAAATLREFEAYCQAHDLRTLYYRVPAEALPQLRALGKRAVPIGQEAVVDVAHFSLVGADRKSLRNAQNSLVKKGYQVLVHEPPLPPVLMQQLAAVSGEWLADTGYHEIGFSQGEFHAAEVARQPVLTVTDAAGKVVGFLNIIPTYHAPDRTYDLIRKTADAPNGTIDGLLLALFEHVRSQDGPAVNLGFVPLATAEDGASFSEKTLRFAYEKVPAFARYHGLYESKDKFGPEWRTRYLVYDTPYDLVQAPLVLNDVIQLPPRS